MYTQHPCCLHNLSCLGRHIACNQLDVSCAELLKTSLAVSCSCTCTQLSRSRCELAFPYSTWPDPCLTCVATCHQVQEAQQQPTSSTHETLNYSSRTAWCWQNLAIGYSMSIRPCSTTREPIMPPALKEMLCLQVQEAAAPDIERLLDTKLQEHSSLVQGQLSNGLKYVILPNAVPPERFEAHLEICAGQLSTSGCSSLQHNMLLACHRRILTY